MKTQIRFAGLDDGGVFGRRNLLGASFLEWWVPLLAQHWLQGGSTSSGTVDVRVPLACSCGLPPPMKFERPSRSFGSDFLSEDVDRAVVVLAVAVVLVSSGSVPDLVDLSSVASCAVLPVFL